jgi:hypothetical protein
MPRRIGPRRFAPGSVVIAREGGTELAMTPDACASRLPIGAPVRTADDQFLGRIIAAIRHVIVVERGWFAPERFLIRPADVVDVRDGTVQLRHTLGEMEAHARMR